MRRKKFTDIEIARYWNENADSWTKQVRKGWDVYREHFNNPFFFIPYTIHLSNTKSSSRI
jgi:hypothetical protein